jgi:hypothetical protein
MWVKSVVLTTWKSWLVLIVRNNNSMEAKEILDHKRMIISINVFNSMIYFVMNTLVQHQEMVNQIQDEVTTLRTQVEDIQLRDSPSNLGPCLDMVISTKRVVSLGSKCPNCIYRRRRRCSK